MSWQNRLTPMNRRAGRLACSSVRVGGDVGTILTEHPEPEAARLCDAREHDPVPRGREQLAVGLRKRDPVTSDTGEIPEPDRRREVVTGVTCTHERRSTRHPAVAPDRLQERGAKRVGGRTGHPSSMAFAARRGPTACRSAASRARGHGWGGGCAAPRAALGRRSAALRTIRVGFLRSAADDRRRADRRRRADLLRWAAAGPPRAGPRVRTGEADRSRSRRRAASGT